MLLSPRLVGDSTMCISEPNMQKTSSGTSKSLPAGFLNFIAKGKVKKVLDGTGMVAFHSNARPNLGIGK